MSTWSCPVNLHIREYTRLQSHGGSYNTYRRWNSFLDQDTSQLGQPAGRPQSGDPREGPAGHRGLGARCTRLDRKSKVNPTRGFPPGVGAYMAHIQNPRVPCPTYSNYRPETPLGLPIRRHPFREEEADDCSDTASAW